MYKKLLATALTLSMVLALAACGPTAAKTPPPATPAPGTSSPPQSEKPYDGVQLTFLRHTGYDADWMAAQCDSFYGLTGIQVTVEQVAYSEMHNKFVVDASSSGGTYDMFATTDYWLPEFYEGGWIVDIAPYLSDTVAGGKPYRLDDVSAALRDVNSIDGKLLAMPWKFNSQMIAYRTDLVAKAPNTWEELLASAKANSAPGTTGIALALGKASVMDVYLDLLYSNGGTFIADDGKTCNLDSPEAKAALQYLMDLSEYASDGAISSHWDEAATLYAQGLAAMCATINTQCGNILDEEKSTVADKTAFCEIPGPVTPCATSSTWGIAITSNCKSPEAAMMYIQYITEAERIRDLIVELKGASIPVRASLLTDTELMGAYPQFAVMNDISTKSGHTFSYPKTSACSAVMEVLAGHIQNALTGVETVDGALAAAKQEIEKLL